MIDPRDGAVPVEQFGGLEPPPGTLVRDGDRFIYYPNPRGSIAPQPKGHAHLMRIIGFSFPPEQLAVLMGCAYCSRSQSVRPNPRITKLPEGFTPASWAKFLEAAARRKAYVNG